MWRAALTTVLWHLRSLGLHSYIRLASRAMASSATAAAAAAVALALALASLSSAFHSGWWPWHPSPQAQPVLHDFILAYYPARARLMLVEKAVPYTTRPLNLLNGDSLRPAFLRVNPAGTLPVLTHGDKTLTQSLDIVRYVDESLGSGGPLGGDGADPALVAQWRSQIDGFDGNLFMSAHMEGGAKALMAKLGTFREK